MQLRAKKRRSQYKSEQAYIRAVYLHNKKKIAKNMDEKLLEANNYNVYSAFKDRIEAYMSYTNPKTGKAFTASEAIKRITRSKYLNKEWTTADVYARNFHELIKKNKRVKKMFYENEMISKIDYSKYEFLGYYNVNGTSRVVYRYGKSYFLEPQSPKGGSGEASLAYLTEWDFEEMESMGKITFEKYRKRRY